MKKTLIIALLFISTLTFGQTTTTQSTGGGSGTSQNYGILPLANGGTNNSLLGSAGTIPYSDGTKYSWNTGTTSTGLILTSNGTGAPSWEVPQTATGSEIIGTIFSDGVSIAGNYTQVHTTGTQTFGTGVIMTGNNGNFTANRMYYNYNGTTGTLLDDYTVTAKVIITADYSGSYGFGVGMRQTADLNGFSVFISTQAAGTRGTIYIVDQIAPTVYATSATKLVFTTSSDTLLISMRYCKNNIIALVSNLTTTTKSESGVNVPNIVTAKYALPMSFAGRISQPGIWSYGGTQKVINLSFSSGVRKNPKIIITGDSRVVGMGASDWKHGYAREVGFNKSDDALMWAKGGLYISDITNGASELRTIINGSSSLIIIIVGINDIVSGHSIGTVKSDYINMLTAIKSAGGVPIPTKISYVTTAYASYATINAEVALLNTWIATLGYNTLDENTSMATGGDMTTIFSTDGIHFNDLGNLYFAKKLHTQIENFYPLVPQFSVSAINVAASSVITGWANGATTMILLSLNTEGTLCTLDVMFNGTSNSGTTNFTFFFTSVTVSGGVYYGNMALTYDNGAFVTQPGNIRCNTNTSIVDLYKNQDGTSFSGTGVKVCYGSITIPIN